MRWISVECIKNNGNTFNREIENCMVNMDKVKKVSKNYRKHAVLHFVDNTTQETNVNYFSFIKEIV
jgi:hypothetical protein